MMINVAKIILIGYDQNFVSTDDENNDHDGCKDMHY